MKFRRDVQWVRIPPGQSLASRPVARLAAVGVRLAAKAASLAAMPVTGRLMCSQANVQAAGNAASKSLIFRMPRTSGCAEGSTLEGHRASREGSGGVLDWGMHEEDIPATWEALADLVQNRATEDRIPFSNAPFVMRERERPVSRSMIAWHAENACPPQGRRDQGKTGGPPSRQGSRMASYEQRRRGTLAPDPPEQRRPVPVESFRREP
jgi:hypothetical protein